MIMFLDMIIVNYELGLEVLRGDCIVDSVIWIFLYKCD